VRRRNQRDEFAALQAAGKLATVIGRHPREFVGVVMATIAIFAIFINALFLQKGPHPAPIFAPRPSMTQDTIVMPRIAPPQQDANAQNRAQLISDIQRELNRRGFFDGVIDGVWGARTDAAAREFAQAAGLTVNVEANDGLLRAIVASRVKARAAATPARIDPIAELIVPSKRIQAIQRALADFGYGQIKPTGLFDPETRSAIEKFERDRRLPVDGEITDRLVRELAGMTGRPLE
jgi:peptidoglycan hydrolase-like protein with peptidoglycan-binding domain